MMKTGLSRPGLPDHPCTLPRLSISQEINMISKELAQRFIENVTRYTEYNVNIMDGDGTIIASRDPERIGKYHEIAWRIIQGREDIIDTTGLQEFPNVLPGINMVILVDGVREGVVGVTGNPEEIRPVALIVKMAIETMLKYERQQEAARLRANRKERFVYMLTQVEHSDPEKLRHMAEELGYPEEMVRIPILIRISDTDADTDADTNMNTNMNTDAGQALPALRESALHAKADFSFVLDPQHLIVFKTLPGPAASMLSDYKFHIRDYLESFLQNYREDGKTVQVFVGSFQDAYSRYYYAYRHCLWLEQNVHNATEPVFFYDYTGSYLQSRIPFGELAHIFQLFEERIPKDKLRTYMESLGALIRTNYNFGKAAEELYIHKNTLVYRYNRLKELMNMDPLSSASDRSFLSMFYFYLERGGFLKQCK